MPSFLNAMGCFLGASDHERLEMQLRRISFGRISSSSSAPLVSNAHHRKRPALLCGIRSPSSVISSSNIVSCRWQTTHHQISSGSTDSSAENGDSNSMNWGALNSLDHMKWANKRSCRGPPLPLPKPLGKQLGSSDSSTKLKQILPQEHENRNVVCQIDPQELAVACKGFGADCCIGHGDRGAIHKCRINDAQNEMEALVIRVPRPDQSLGEWIGEVKALAGLGQHPHLSKLIGYSFSHANDHQRFFIYQRSSNGTLDSFLYGARSKDHLDFSKRMKILLGSAKALAFLHAAADSNSQVAYYRELRTINIGVDKDFSGKLMGYSLWRKKEEAADEIGAFAAPETVCEGRLSKKSNVWSWGVIMLEVLTGREIIEGNPKDLILLSSRLLFEDDKKMGLLLDPVLRCELDQQRKLRCARKISGLARKCFQLDPSLRPSMNQVVQVLLQCVAEEAENKVSLRQILHHRYS